jgi:hypothetical protein
MIAKDSLVERSAVSVCSSYKTPSIQKITRYTQYSKNLPAAGKPSQWHSGQTTLLVPQGPGFDPRNARPQFSVTFSTEK